MKSAKHAAIGAVLIALLAVPSLSAKSLVYPDDYDPRYVESVNECKQPTLTSDRIDFNLTTIGSNDHIRNPSLPGNPILMTTFTDYTNYNRGYDGVGQSRRELWAAVAPEMWQFHQVNNTAPGQMLSRTQQLLGLPQDHKGYFVMEYWIQPGSLFRPAMDPSITNPVSSLTFPSYMKPGNYYYDWFQANMSTYNTVDSHGKPQTPYPWSRLGYTFDWGSNVRPNIGLSEFIADKQVVDPLNPANNRLNPIWVQSIIAIESYKYYQRDSQSFDVTD